MRLYACLLKQISGKAMPKLPAKQVGLLGRAFGKYLFITNTVTSGGLMAIGDFCQQQIEAYQNKPAKVPYDTRRTTNMGVVALGHGVFHHCFYGWMDRILPVTTVRTVFFKILLDQTIASPVCLYIFFIGLAIMENRGIESGWKEMKQKFKFTYMMDWIVWPPNQFINFYYIPAKYRVFYINFVSMLYDVFLSYVKFYADFGTEK